MSKTIAPALVPPFTRETAILKVRKAEDGWIPKTLSSYPSLIRPIAFGVIEQNS